MPPVIFLVTTHPLEKASRDGCYRSIRNTLSTHTRALDVRVFADDSFRCLWQTALTSAAFRAWGEWLPFLYKYHADLNIP
jgi:hypothetical protein